MTKLYNLPLYYDIAFSVINPYEWEILDLILEKHIPFPVKNILESACGTGRMVIDMAKRGYQVVGYDNNPAMLEFARVQADREGVSDRVSLVEADMKGYRPRGKYELAVNLINTLGYLHSDEDIISHFKNTSHALKPSGVYMIFLDCAFEGPLPTEENKWTAERDGVTVRTRWDVLRQDFDNKLSYQECHMEIFSQDRLINIQEEHVMRLWFYEDLKALIKQSGMFEIAAIYTQDKQSIPLEAHITGEDGNLYYVLQRI